MPLEPVTQHARFKFHPTWLAVHVADPRCYGVDGGGHGAAERDSGGAERQRLDVSVEEHGGLGGVQGVGEGGRQVGGLGGD